MDVLNANCGVRIRISSDDPIGYKSPARRAARAALGLPSEPVGEPFDIPDDDDELADLLPIRLAGVADQGKSCGPGHKVG